MVPAARNPEANPWTRIVPVVAIALLAPACGDGDPQAAEPDAPAPVPETCAPNDGWASVPAVAGGANQETAVVAVRGKIYVLGGLNGTVGTLRSVRIFDPATCTWSTGPLLPEAVHHANAAVARGAIYVLGALTGNFNATGDVWAWDPETETAWTPRASMPAGSERGSAVTGVIEDWIYVAGGLAGGAAVTALSRYSILLDRWETDLPPLPQPRDHACGGAIGDKLYVAGGRMASTTSVSAALFEYTPDAGWTERAPMPTARGGMGCGLEGPNLYVAGGEGNAAAPTGVFPQVESYDASADRWFTREAMPTPRHGMGAAVSGGVLYVPGGATSEGLSAVDTHEALRVGFPL